MNQDVSMSGTRAPKLLNAVLIPEPNVILLMNARIAHLEIAYIAHFLRARKGSLILTSGSLVGFVQKNISKT